MTSISLNIEWKIEGMMYLQTSNSEFVLMLWRWECGQRKRKASVGHSVLGDVIQINI